MKKILLLLSVALVLGFTGPASASKITVKSGDTMWKISKRYNVSFPDVLKLNNNYDNVHLIHPGDIITIPEGSNGTSTDKSAVGKGNATAIQGTANTNEQSVLDLVNQQRKNNGLSELQMSDKLVDLAEMKAEDMAENNYFSHTSPTYGTPFEMLKTYGVSYKSAGENIAAGQKTADEVMTSWMNSSGHRANILNSKYTHIGIGYIEGGTYDSYWVQLFVTQ